MLTNKRVFLFLSIVLTFSIFLFPACDILRPYYELNVSTVGEGSVEQNPLPDPDKGKYERGTNVTLTPEPDEDFEFSHWSGEHADDVKALDTENQYAITMDEDKSIEAVFELLGLEIIEVEAVDEYHIEVRYNRNLVPEDTIEADMYEVTVNGEEVTVQDVSIETHVVTLEVNLNDMAGTVTVNSVEGNKVDFKDPTVTLSPAEDQTVLAGETLEFTAEARDSFDQLITDDVTDFTWENAVEGVFSEENAGTYEVTATFEGVVSDPTSVTVNPGPVDTVTLDPSEDQTVYASETLEFSAEARDEYGNLITDDAADFIWDNAVEGVFSEEVTGTYEVKASYNEVESAPTTVTVLQADVATVDIIPKEDQEVSAGETLSFAAEARDEYGNLITDDVTDFTWENAIEGTFSKETAGQYEVSATYQGVSSETVVVTVVPDSPSFVTVDVPGEIKQGDELLADFSELKDQYDNLVSGTFSVEVEFGAPGDTFNMEDVEFVEGTARDVQIQTGAETAARSADSYQVTFTIEEAQAVESIDVLQVLKEFTIADVVIHQREALNINLHTALDKAGDPFSGEVELAINTDELMGVDEGSVEERTISEGILEFTLLTEEETNIEPQDEVQLTAEIHELRTPFLVTILPEDHLIEETSFRGSIDDISGILFVSGALRIVNWTDAITLDFPENVYAYDGVVYHEIDLTEESIFSSEDGKDLIISFIDVELADDRGSPFAPIAFELLDDDGQVLTSLTVDVEE